MEAHYLSEQNLLIFLLQVALLLGFSRALGEVFRRFGQPSITAEILVGVLFGPTVFGRLFPELHRILFPADNLQRNMLETVAWLGILLFLLKSGLETNFATAWRQRRHALVLSLSDLIIPMAVAFAPAFFLPDSYMGPDVSRLSFAAFIATIMTISALPVTVRVMQELRMYRTDLGLLILSALTINDVAGWIVFAMVLGGVTESAASIPEMGFVLVATLAFAAAALTAGSRLFDGLLRRLQSSGVPEPAASLTLVSLTGILCGALTLWIGIHALFGFFIAGLLAGESPRLSERTRSTFAQMVQAILVPLFFASVGLHIDFAHNFDPFIVAFILFVGSIGRYAGAYWGARRIGQPSGSSVLIAHAHVPGGEMQIVIGILALEYGVITETVYVAIVFGAVVTSMFTGPLMRRALSRVHRTDWLMFLPVDHILPPLEASDSRNAIDRICQMAVLQEEDLAEFDVCRHVAAREEQMSTAIGHGVAVPHARIEGLKQPFLFLARSREGIAWDSEDGEPVRLVFLLLTPQNEPEMQLFLLRQIALSAGNPKIRRELETAPPPEVLEILRAATTAPIIRSGGPRLSAD